MTDGTIVIIWSLVVILIIVVFLYYDVHKHPVCSLCGHNLYAKIIKGKIVCQVHK